MKLQIGNFHVKDVVFGEQTAFENGILTINKEEAIAFIKEDTHITFADIEIAKPGEDVRIVPVKEAAEPRARVDGRTLFPGVTGELAPCGEGELHALKGVSVLGVGKHWGSFGDGLVDMSGEGQKYTLFGSLINVCLVIDDDVEEERHEQQKKNRAIRWATHLFAEYLGKTVLEQTPDEVETYELPPVLHRGPEVERLPSVVLVMQPQS
ncbi:MAG: betaine reductase, partial [Tissierellia bacterium]|nr:betaine reductase [Tissierellia bacterium]